MQEASEIAIGDQAIVPLRYQELTYTPRSDENTLAHLVRPTN